MAPRTKTPYSTYEGCKNDIHSLIMDNMGLVKSLATRLDVTFQPAVSFDDLISAGTVGLVEAAHRYKSGMDAKFSTFAYQRIRGAMLDLLRAHDPLGKSARAKLGEIHEAITEFQSENRCTPSIKELAVLVDMPKMEVLRYLSYEKWNYMGSLNRGDSEEETPTTLDALLGSDIDTPLEKLEREEFATKLAETIKSLSKREQQIIVMYYYEELYMAEIAEVLGITQSRVSQIHTSALYNLGRKLREAFGNE